MLLPNWYESYKIAEKRIFSMEGKVLKKESHMQQLFNDSIKGYIEKEYALILTDEEFLRTDTMTFYLPILYVHNRNKEVLKPRLLQMIV